MPRKKQPISFDDVLNLVPSLSTRQIQRLITQMQQSNLTDNQKKNLTKIISSDLDTHAEKLGLGKICPKCGSVIVKRMVNVQMVFKDYNVMIADIGFHIFKYNS